MDTLQGTMSRVLALVLYSGQKSIELILKQVNPWQQLSLIIAMINHQEITYIRFFHELFR